MREILNRKCILVDKQKTRKRPHALAHLLYGKEETDLSKFKIPSSMLSPPARTSLVTPAPRTGTSIFSTLVGVFVITGMLAAAVILGLVSTTQTALAGDAGLASSTSSGWILFAIGGLTAFALASLATLKFARR